MVNPRYSNGHRRRELRTRLLATQRYCPWEFCPWPDEPFDRKLSHLDSRAPEVDEVIPIRHGGSPLDRSNTRLLHRYCNQQRYQQTRRRTPVPDPAAFTTSREW